MIGNSMGGVVAVNLAIKKPERVSKLVTIGGVGPNLFSPVPVRACACSRNSPTPRPRQTHPLAQRHGLRPQPRH